MRTFLIAIVLAAASLHAQQWGGINGRVLDPSGASVPDAVVLLTSRDAVVQRSARVAAHGDYLFSSVPAGEYLLSVRAPGFSSGTPAVLTLSTGESLTHDFSLQIARVSSGVQVTATSTAQSADEQAKAADVVDAAQLAARAEYSVAEAVRSLPGLRVQQLGGPGSLTRVHARGLRPFDTSVLLDGVRLRDAASPQGEASAFIGDLMLVNADRVEVLRGSGSSLYGTNAEGGVINVVTAPGGGGVHGDVSADGGGLGLLRGVARIGGGAWADRLRYSAGVSHLNVTRGIDGNDAYRNSSAQASADYDVLPGLTLSGRLFASDAFSQLNENPYVAGSVALPGSGIVRAIPALNYTPALDDPDSVRASRFVSGVLAASGRVGTRAGWRLSYHNLSTNRDNRDGPAGTFFPPEHNNSNFFGGRVDTLQARTDLQAGRLHFLTAGYEWEREAFDNHSRDFNPDAAARTDARVRINQRSHTLFVQDQIRLFGDRLQVSLSGRTQGFTLARPDFAGGAGPYPSTPLPDPPRAWTGDASVAYYLRGSGTKLRAHVGNGYRAPSLYERFGASFFFGSFTAYGDPRLAPERLISADGGIDQYLWNSRVRVSATYFYTRLQEVIAFDFSGAITPATDPFGRWGGYTNAKGGLSRGAEFAVEARPASGTVVQTAYTYTNADDRRSIYAGGELRSINVSTHMLTANASQRIGRRLSLGFDLLAAGDYLFPLFVGFQSRAFEWSGPVKADLSATYTVPLTDTRSLKFFTRVENVFDRTYYEDGFRTPGAWAVGGMKFVF